jgi:hypothetical protein
MIFDSADILKVPWEIVVKDFRTRSRVSFFMNRFRKLGLIDYNGQIEVHSSLWQHNRKPHQHVNRKVFHPRERLDDRRQRDEVAVEAEPASEEQAEAALI